MYLECTLGPCTESNGPWAVCPQPVNIWKVVFVGIMEKDIWMKLLFYIRMGPKPSDKHLHEGRKGEKTHRGEGHVRAEAETRVMQPQATDCRQRLEARSEAGTDCPQILWKEPTLPTPWFETSGWPGLGENILVLFQATEFVVSCYSSPRKLRQTLFEVGIAGLAVLQMRQTKKKKGGGGRFMLAKL